jgi:DNA repair exonuclease SbcCD ATPase subunit
MDNGWTKRIEELEAENKRLRMYRDAAESRAQGLEVERDAAVKWLEEYKSKTYCAYCGAIFNIDSDASHVSEHIRTCPHHPMRELEAENERLRKRIAELEAENMRLQLMNPCKHTGFEAAPCDICGYPDPRKLIAKLKAENKRLRELVDGARVIVEVFQWSTPAQERWREEWLKKAEQAMKEASHD